MKELVIVLMVKRRTLTCRALTVVLALTIATCSSPPPGAGADPQTTPEPLPSGTKDDPFRWLEEARGERALAWVHEQNARTLGQLTEDPRYRCYQGLAHEIAQDASRIPASSIFDAWLHDDWVYNLWQDDAHPRGLFRRSPLESYMTAVPEWQTLLDVDELARSEGRNWHLRSPIFLPRGRHCMIGLSDGGRDTVAYREFDLERRAFVPDGFVLPDSYGVTLAWRDENTLLVATDWGPDSVTVTGLPTVVKVWSRGQPLSRSRELFRGAGGVAVQQLGDDDGDQVIVVSESGSERRLAYWQLNRDGALVRMNLPFHARLSALHRDELVFSIHDDWTAGGETWRNGSLLSVPLAQVSSSQPPEVRLLVEPRRRERIGRTDGTSGGVLAHTSFNVRGRLLRLTFDGTRWIRDRVPVPDDGTISPVMTDAGGGTAFVRYESFLQPPTVYAIDVAANRAVAIKRLRAQFDGGDYMVEQLEATSSDETRVPYFLVRRRALVADGQNPTLMHGYGYQGASQFPHYSGFLGRLWLDQGGAYVLANIRGGGEFGPSWHVTKTQRQLVYDDFIAVAEDLVRRGITSPRRLGIRGMSAGGLLMGVMLTQRPDLFNAAVVEVPVLDLLNENLLGGRSRFVEELGSLGVPEERAFLEQTSPYQNLRRQTDFPTPFLATSTTDEKAHPAFARKFAAKMEALGMPFFYYESAEGGHDIWSTPDQQARYQALVFTYLAQQLMTPSAPPEEVPLTIEGEGLSPTGES